jgi:hypothetical protein
MPEKLRILSTLNVWCDSGGINDSFGGIFVGPSAILLGFIVSPLGDTNYVTIDISLRIC